MKKYLLFITTLFLVSGLFTSCESDFLDTKPTDAYDENTALTTTEGLINIINGMHKNLYKQYNSTQSNSGIGGLNIFRDALGEDLVWPNRGNGWFISEYQWSSHRNKSSNLSYYAYQFYYMLIANANKVINAADNAKGTDAERKIAKGQALAYRAFAHFDLVQLYAPRYSASTASTDAGIPLLTVYTTEPQPRATVAKVYEQIELDLRDAAANLEGYNRGSDKSQLNKAIVLGLQARVALAKGEYADARDYANAARTAFMAEGGKLMTSEEYKGGFNSVLNPEWIWGSKVIDDQTLYFFAFHAYMSYNYSSTNIRNAPKCINSTLYANIAATDVRHFLWEANPTEDNFPLPTTAFSRAPYMNRKFAVVNSGSSVADIMYMRLAEMYLIEAEAKAHLGEADAADVLNELIVTRDPSYDAASYAAAAGRDILEEVLIQRRIELWGEGFRFTDLKRLNLPLDRTGANHDDAVAQKMKEPAGTKEWQFHFPRKEEDANPHIGANPNL